MLNIPIDWASHVRDDRFDSLLERIEAFLQRERDLGHTYFPKDELIFHALEATPYERVKVVLVGQDPYHGPSQAHGLSFSVPTGIQLPPSLQNIYKELLADLNIPIARTGNLASWASQGVLLLNATLTVRQGQPLSHHGQGWEEITDVIIEAVARKQEPVVFLLWGKNAQAKCAKFSLESKRQHLVLKAAHPSPFSAHQGFMGCRHFSRANAFLKEHGASEVDWRVEKASLVEAISEISSAQGLWDLGMDEATL